MGTILTLSCALRCEQTFSTSTLDEATKHNFGDFAWVSCGMGVKFTDGSYFSGLAFIRCLGYLLP